MIGALSSVSSMSPGTGGASFVDDRTSFASTSSFIRESGVGSAPPMRSGGDGNFLNRLQDAELRDGLRLHSSSSALPSFTSFTGVTEERDRRAVLQKTGDVIAKCDAALDILKEQMELKKEERRSKRHSRHSRSRSRSRPGESSSAPSSPPSSGHEPAWS